jgi:hypothetical protein
MVAKVDDALANGECVHYVLKGGGIEAEGEWQTLTGKAYLAVTPTRTVGKQYSGLGNDVATVSIDHSNVSSVEFRSGRFFSNINLKTEGKNYNFFNVKIDDGVGKAIVEFIRSAGESESVAGDDPIKQLERIRDLREDGTLSEDEFQRAKGKLLDQL